MINIGLFVSFFQVLLSTIIKLYFHFASIYMYVCWYVIIYQPLIIIEFFIMTHISKLIKNVLITKTSTYTIVVVVYIHTNVQIIESTMYIVYCLDLKSLWCYSFLIKILHEYNFACFWLVQKLFLGHIKMQLLKLLQNMYIFFHCTSG